MFPRSGGGQTYSENKELGGSDRFEGDPIAQPLNSPCELVDEMGLSTVIQVGGSRALRSWLQSNRLGGDDVTDDQLGVLDNDTVHHKLSHFLLYGESGFGQGTASARTEPFQALQQPEFLFPLPALLLKLSQPAAQDLLMVQTASQQILVANSREHLRKRLCRECCKG